MNATDQRLELMALADKLAIQRKELLETVNKINAGISALVGAGDALLPPAMDEKEAGVKPTVKPISINETIESNARTIHEVTSPRQKHCSNCGEPGHTARTCTNERKPESEEPKAEKPKRQLSEERKAQLRETLKKARAARKEKKR
jgi:hypothetical protein